MEDAPRFLKMPYSRSGNGGIDHLHKVSDLLGGDVATCAPLLGVGEKQLLNELGIALVPLAGSIHFSSFLLCTGTELRQWEKTKCAAAYKQPVHL